MAAEGVLGEASGTEVPEPAAVKVAPEQQVYADTIAKGTRVALVVLVVTQILYLSGALPGYVAPEQWPHYWGMRAADAAHALHLPTGWQWAGLLGYGDMLSLVGVALLASLTVVGYLVLLPAYVRRRDVAYAIIAVSEIVVLVLAASGILSVGGH